MSLTDAIDVLMLTIHAHAGAGDRQEYADAIPIHRLQFPHNNPAIVLVDVHASTLHIGLVQTWRWSWSHKSSITSMASKSLAAMDGHHLSSIPQQVSRRDLCRSRTPRMSRMPSLQQRRLRRAGRRRRPCGEPGY